MRQGSFSEGGLCPITRVDRLAHHAVRVDGEVISSTVWIPRRAPCPRQRRLVNDPPNGRYYPAAWLRAFRSKLRLRDHGAVDLLARAVLDRTNSETPGVTAPPGGRLTVLRHGSGDLEVKQWRTADGRWRYLALSRLQSVRIVFDTNPPLIRQAICSDALDHLTVSQFRLKSERAQEASSPQSDTVPFLP